MLIKYPQKTKTKTKTRGCSFRPPIPGNHRGDEGKNNPTNTHIFLLFPVQVFYVGQASKV